MNKRKRSSGANYNPSTSTTRSFDAKLRKMNDNSNSTDNCIECLDFANFIIKQTKTRRSFFKAVKYGLRHIKPNIHTKSKELQAMCKTATDDDDFQSDASNICKEYAINMHIIDEQNKQTLVYVNSTGIKTLEARNCNFQNTIHLIQIGKHNFSAAIYRYDSYVGKKGVFGIKGDLYEIYLTMYLFIEAQIKRQSKIVTRFYIASNMEKVGDFDDVVFKYWYKKDNEIKCKMLFFQLKHGEKTNKVKATELISPKNALWYLGKFFQSYRQIKMRFAEIKNVYTMFHGNLSDCQFIIFSNRPCSETGQNIKFTKNESTLDILNMLRNNLNAKNYFFKVEETNDSKGKDEKIKEKNNQKVKECISKSSDCFKLTESILNHPRGDGEIVKKYINPLKVDVLEILKENDTNKNLTYRVKKSFLKGENIPEKNKIFRKIFVEVLKASRKPTSIEEELIDIQIPKSMKGNQTCDQLPDDEVDQDDIEIFLQSLYYYFDQPNQEELKEIILERLQVLYPTENDIDELFSYAQDKFTTWHTKGPNQYIKEDCDFIESFVCPVRMGVKNPVPLFTGRIKDMENINNTLNKENILVVHGLGGIGKTQVVRKYIREYWLKRGRHIVWINAENQSEIHKGFNRLASDILKIVTKNIKIKEIIRKVFNYFENKGALFIFDNADEEEFHDILSEMNKNINVLITSRSNKWDMPKLELDHLIPDDSIEFVKKSLNIDPKDTSQDRAIGDLVKKLQNFPLALQQAISYIKCCLEKKIDSYLKEFETHMESSFKSDLYLSYRSDYTKTTLTTWLITIEKIKKQSNGDWAIHILKMMAYITPENIQKTMFLPSLKCNEEELHSGIELLAKYSMIDEEANKVNIHRLVQEFVRSYIDDNSKRDILEKTLSLFQNIDESNINHAMSALTYVRKLKIKIAFENYTTIPLSIMYILRSSTRYHDACKFGEDMFELLRDHEMNPEYLCQLKICLGLVFHDRKKYKNALGAFKIAQDIKSKNQSDHWEVLNIDSLIASVYFDIEELEKVKNILQKILQEQKESMENGVLNSRLNEEIHQTERKIAMVLMKQKEYEEAREILKCIYEMQLKENSGKDSRESFKTMKELGNTYIYEEKYEKALEIYSNILEKQDKIFGENDLDRLHTCYNMGYAHEHSENYEKAFEIYKAVHEKQKIEFGDKHPVTLRTYEDIGHVYMSQKRFKQARKIFKEVNKITPTDQESDKRKRNNNIACTYMEEKEYKKAIKIYEEIKIDNLNDPKQLHIAFNNERSKYKINKLKKGEEYRNDLELLELIMENYKRKHMYNDMIDTIYLTAKIYLKHNDSKNALTYFQKVQEESECHKYDKKYEKAQNHIKLCTEKNT